MGAFASRQLVLLPFPFGFVGQQVAPGIDFGRIWQGRLAVVSNHQQTVSDSAAIEISDHPSRTRWPGAEDGKIHADTGDD